MQTISDFKRAISRAFRGLNFHVFTNDKVGVVFIVIDSKDAHLIYDIKHKGQEEVTFGVLVEVRTINFDNIAARG